jgi:hypothetical protein
LKDLTVHGLGAQNHYDEEEDQMNLHQCSLHLPEPWISYHASVVSDSP